MFNPELIIEFQQSDLPINLKNRLINYIKELEQAVVLARQAQDTQTMLANDSANRLEVLQKQYSDLETKLNETNKNC